MMVTEGEYLFIYNGKKIEDKEAKGYALSIRSVKINERDINADHLTEKQIAEIAQQLDTSIANLHDTKSDDSSTEKMEDEDLVRVLAKNPELMKTPIILSKEKSFIVDSPYELINEKIENQNISDGYTENSPNN